MNWFKKASAQQPHKETVAEAFLRQAGIDPSADEQQDPDVHIYHRGGGHAVQISRTRGDLGEFFLQDAIRKYEQSCSNFEQMKQSMGKLRIGDIDQQTVPHPLMAGYDHSLEINRWKGKSKSDEEIEMGDLTSGDV